MRESKFRGKSIETNEWVYGCGWYHIDYTEEYKKENNMRERANLLTNRGFVECYLESMGQFTGLKDKSGVEIYEGDIVQADGEYGDGLTGEIYYKNGCFMLRDHALYQIYNAEIIGTIYENPDILQ